MWRLSVCAHALWSILQYFKTPTMHPISCGPVLILMQKKKLSMSSWRHVCPFKNLSSKATARDWWWERGESCIITADSRGDAALCFSCCSWTNLPIKAAPLEWLVLKKLCLPAVYNCTYGDKRGSNWASKPTLKITKLLFCLWTAVNIA